MTQALKSPPKGPTIEYVFMPASYTDQFWLIDPFAPPPSGTQLLVQTYDMIDANDDGQIGGAVGDMVDGVVVVRAYPGDSVTVTWPNGTQSTVTGTTLYLRDGREVFTPSDGSVLDDVRLVTTSYVPSSGTLDVDTLGPPCLVAGTGVMTPNGTRLVETLKAGDQVLAADGRSLTLRGVLSTTVHARRQRSQPQLRPIRIVAGALGRGLPERDLVVSRQHRMVLRSNIAQRMFGRAKVLVAAAKLLDLPGVFVEDDAPDVTYLHLLFDDHEIILAEGAETESLLIGPGLVDSISPEALREILHLFPEAVDRGITTSSPALPIPSPVMTKKLLARHAKNNKPIYDV